MSNKSFSTIIAASLFANGLFIAAPANAEQPSPFASAEAAVVIVHMDKDMHSGTVTATGCDACPLRLVVDSDSQFSSGEQAITANEISGYSGKPATILYYKEDMHVSSIRW